RARIRAADAVSEQPAATAHGAGPLRAHEQGRRAARVLAQREAVQLRHLAEGKEGADHARPGLPGEAAPGAAGVLLSVAERSVLPIPRTAEPLASGACYDPRT